MIARSITVKRIVSLPEGMAQRFAQVARDAGAGARLIYPLRFGGDLGVEVSLRFKLAYGRSAAQVEIVGVPV